MIKVWNPKSIFMVRKSFDVLQSESLVLQPGSFVDANGNQVTLNDSEITMIYNNIDGAIPIYFKHSGDRVPKGYASVFEHDDNKLLYGGHIYENDTLKRVSLDGYSDSSAEIELEYDDHGTVINGKLTGIAIVKKGIIGDTNMALKSVAFGNDGEPTSQGSNTPTVPEPQPAKGSEHDVTKYLEQISTLKTERNQYKKMYETLIKQQVDGVVQDLTGMGFKEPTKIVEGLSLDQQLSVLTNLKSNAVLNKPANEPPAGAPAPSADDQKDQALKELGISQDYYKKVMSE